jgi:hypothetical protein
VTCGSSQQVEKKSPGAEAGANHVRAYLLLAKYHAAIDQQRLAGHIVGVRTGEIRDAGRDVFRLGKPPKGNAFGELLGSVAQRFTRRFGNLTVNFRPQAF